MLPDCVFCQIVAGTSPADIVCRWEDAVAFRPLNPVTNGHTLVIPDMHVESYTADPDIACIVMQRAASLAPYIDRESNLITSAGPAATQSIFHLHLHIVPRHKDDGLLLPWSR